MHISCQFNQCNIQLIVGLFINSITMITYADDHIEPCNSIDAMMPSQVSDEGFHSITTNIKPEVNSEYVYL